MKKINVCLISPHKRSNVQIMPISLIYLAAWMEKKGIHADIIDIKTSPYKITDSQEEDRVINKIIEQVNIKRPFLIGITCFTSEYNSVILLAASIKKSVNIKIIVGGTHATLSPEDFIYKGSPVDFVAIGEGQETLAELIFNLSDSNTPEKVNGIAFLQDSDVYKTPPRAMIEDLDELPMPSYHKLDMEYYTSISRCIIRYLYTSGVHILTSFGCPFDCTFCAAKNLWRTPQAKSRIRYRPIKQIVDEIQFLKDHYHIDSFNIADDTFAISQKRAIDFCEELLGRDIRIIWAMETRVNLVSDELLKMVKRAGCIQVGFGVESGSQEALDRMKKNIRIEDTVQAFKLCREHGLRTFANMMLNTPEETSEDVRKTIALKKHIKASHASVYLTMPMIGTDIYEKYVHPKIKKEEYGIFEDPHLYTKILDPRFRLAQHDINLDRLYYIVNLRNYLNSFLEFTLNPMYLRSIISSRRRWQLMPAVFLNFSKQVKAYILFVVNRLKTFMVGFKNKV